MPTNLLKPFQATSRPDDHTQTTSKDTPVLIRHVTAYVDKLWLRSSGEAGVEG